MARSYRGAVSFALIMVMAAIGIYASFMYSKAWGIAYSLTVAAAIVLVVVVYCAKCPGKRICVHVFPGLIARYIARTPKPYSMIELAVTALAFLALALVPQPALAGSAGLLAVFWIVALTAATDIVFYVCFRCGNVFCPLNGKKRR